MKLLTKHINRINRITPRIPRIFSHLTARDLDFLFWLTICCIVISALLILCGCGGTTPPAAPALRSSGSTVFFGDSIFGRWNLDADFPGKGYINGGMFGYRTDQLLAILPAVLSGAQVCHGLAGNAEFPLTCAEIPPPSTIVILAGWNNFFQGNPGNTSLSDIQAMVKLAQASGVRVIVATVYAYDPAHPQPWMQPTGNAPITFYDMWRVPLNRGLESSGVAILDLSSLFAQQTGYTLDGVHPTEAGYSQMRDLFNQLR